MRLQLFVAVPALALSVAGRVVLYRDHDNNQLSDAGRNASEAWPNPAMGFFEDDFATPQDWERYTTKGGGMLCGLVVTDRIAGTMLQDGRDPPLAASEWQGGLVQELITWYWHDLVDDQSYCDIADRWEMGHALKSLGLNGKSKNRGGDNECFSIEHQTRSGSPINQYYEVGGKQYRATGASYTFAVNQKGGAIYCFYVTSPKSAARSNWYGEKRDPDMADLPKLRRLSDVLWGFWFRDNPDIKNIRYFFMIGISNDLTNQLIVSALKNAKKKLTEWPGARYSTETDEGKALLGSPNGAAFAYFLMQHKSELGYKTIPEVTVFRPENDDDNDFVDASLVFRVADAPEPPADPPTHATSMERRSAKV